MSNIWEIGETKRDADAGTAFLILSNIKMTSKKRFTTNYNNTNNGKL